MLDSTRRSAVTGWGGLECPAGQLTARANPLCSGAVVHVRTVNTLPEGGRPLSRTGPSGAPAARVISRRAVEPAWIPRLGAVTERLSRMRPRSVAAAAPRRCTGFPSLRVARRRGRGAAPLGRTAAARQACARPSPWLCGACPARSAGARLSVAARGWGRWPRRRPPPPVPRQGRRCTTCPTLPASTTGLH